MDWTNSPFRICMGFSSSWNLLLLHFDVGGVTLWFRHKQSKLTCLFHILTTAIDFRMWVYLKKNIYPSVKIYSTHWYAVSISRTTHSDITNSIQLCRWWGNVVIQIQTDSKIYCCGGECMKQTGELRFFEKHRVCLKNNSFIILEKVQGYSACHSWIFSLSRHL